MWGAPGGDGATRVSTYTTRLLAQPRVSKYRARRVEVDGIRFDSQKEARLWQVLRQRLASGELVRLERQVRFELTAHGCPICVYVADFAFVNHDGEYHVVDVKSDFTRKLPIFRLKSKLFRAQMGFDIEEW